ncbi:MAG: hypothetical protein HC817_09385 [Saprospiraceae bacterium]|nr:hypothetical protein [Saprospiraceae bacterium]
MVSARLLPKNAEILRGRLHRNARHFFMLKYMIIKFLRRFYQSKSYKIVYKWREKTLSNLARVVNVFIKFMPRNYRWQWSKSDLAHFPEGTIGKDLFNFLEKNNFDILPFLETHDVYHIILGYKPTLLDEARLYFFLLGNGKRSLEVLATVWTSLWVLPDCWLDLYAHFKQGKAAPTISHLNFKHLLHEKTLNFVSPTFSTQNTEGVDQYKVVRFFLI